MKSTLLLVCAASFLAGCGADGDSPASIASGGGPIIASGLTLSGTVVGLMGSGLVLAPLSAASDPTPIASNGKFSFASDVFSSGASYFVTVQNQPQEPAQHCVVNNGAGTFAGGNISNVSIVCASVGRFLYSASATDSTVNAFAIDAATGSLTPAGPPVATGRPPRAMVASPDGKHLYVLDNLGPLLGYAVNESSGQLTQIPGLSVQAYYGEAIAMDPTGTYLYVSNNFDPSVELFAVDVASGNLTQIPGSPGVGDDPGAMVVDRHGDLLIIASAGSNSLSVFQIAPATGKLLEVPGSPFPAGGSPHSLALALNGTYLYTANLNGSQSSIAGFNLDWKSGSVAALQGSPFALSVDNELASDLEGNVLFVTGHGGLDEYVMTTNFGTDGSTPGQLFIQPGSPFVTGSHPQSIVLDPSGQFVYAANEVDGTISGFRFDLPSGTLTAVPGSPFSSGTSPVALATL